MAALASDDALLAMGWGLLIDSRHSHDSHHALILFANEEAPRWIPFPELAAHRRALLTAIRQRRSC